MDNNFNSAITSESAFSGFPQPSTTDSAALFIVWTIL